MQLSPKTMIAGVIAAAILTVAPTASAAIPTGGSTGMQIVASALSQAYLKSSSNTDKARFTVGGGGSGAGISGAAAGTFAIGNSSRAWKSSDGSGLQFWPVTNEPFVVVVNPRNPIRSLTEAQIQGIFKGTTTNWKDVGGSNCAIKGYTRTGTSGTLSTFKTLYLGGASISTSFAAVGSNGLIRSSVANNACAVGFVTYAYTVGTTVIKSMPVAGIAPSLANVTSGKFKYAGLQYFVTKGTPTGSVLRYIQWVRGSAQAKAIISKYALASSAAVDIH